MKSKLKITARLGKRAVAYLRKSSDQQEVSIPRQRESIHQYATRNDYQIGGEFVDSAITGLNSTGKRDAFTEMIEAARRGEFDYVIVWDQSRLTRSDAMKTAAELQPLRETGVKLVTCDKGILDWDNFAGQLMTMIEAETNNAYIRKISLNATAGQLRRAQSGKWVAGRPPVGYEVGEAGVLVLGDPAEVKLVRDIFDSYLAGKSIRETVALIRKRGHDRGVSWVKQTLSKRCYTGDAVWNQNTQASLHSVRDGAVSTKFNTGKTDEADQIIVPKSHPAIVTREQFDAVQARLKANRTRTTPTQGGGGFILTGLCRCAKCGSTMTGVTSADRKYYRCGGYATKGADYCDPNFVHQGEVIDAIVGALREQIDPKEIERRRKELGKQAAKQSSEADLKALNRERATVEKRLQAAKVRLMEVPSDMVQVVAEQIRGIQEQVEQLDEDIRQASTKPADTLKAFDAKMNAAIAMIDNLADTLKKNPEIARDLLVQIIAEVRLDVSRREAGSRHKYTLEGGELFLNQALHLFRSW